MSSVAKKVSSYAGDECEGLITWLLDLVLSIFMWVIKIIDTLCLFVDDTLAGVKEAVGFILTPELADLAEVLGKMALENTPKVSFWYSLANNVCDAAAVISTIDDVLSITKP